MGEKTVTSRNWVKLFLSTLFIGGITTGFVGFIIRWGEFKPLFINVDIVGILSTLFWLVGVGFIFSVISQMGFFAYLTIHRFGLGIFRSVSRWNIVQIVLIVFALFDLVYFRYQAFANKGDSIIPYLSIAVLVFVIGLIVSWIKVKQTSKAAFVPALFFMVVVTIVEWVPVLQENEQSWLFLMFFPLVICNTYQLLMLHKLNEQSAIERNLKTVQKSS